MEASKIVYGMMMVLIVYLGVVDGMNNGEVIVS